MKNTESIVFEKNKDEIERLQRYFKTAEKHLKIVERKKIILDSDIIGPDIAAIEELSNAAYYTIEALIEKDSRKQAGLIEKAIGFCGKAGFEALKMGVLDMLKEVHKTKKRYKKDLISNIIPNWAIRLSESKKVLVELERVKKSGEDVQDYYAYIEKEYNKIFSLIEDIQMYEPQLIENKRKRLIDDGAYKIWFICGLISIFMYIILTFA